MWGPTLSPNIEYLKLWVCVRAVTLRCLKMAELICIQFKYFSGISFLSELGLSGTTKMESIHRNRSIFWNIGFLIHIEENDAGLEQLLMKQIYDETDDFSDVKQMFLIHLLRQLQLHPQYFMINQKHPLQTYREFCQVEEFLMQILVHCLQVQIKS